MLNLEKALIDHCAPTLAALKVASLFRYFPAQSENTELHIERLNQTLCPYGLRIQILSRSAKSYLLYVYRTQMLNSHLSMPAIRSFLTEAGYDIQYGTDALLSQLSLRLQQQSGCPHEIGVFLGYPLCDVLGFIQNRGKDYKLSGYWKVYENPDAAQRQFNTYRHCTQLYRRLYQRGQRLAQLTVYTTTNRSFKERFQS